MDMNLSQLRETVKDRGAQHAAVHIGLHRVRHDLPTEQQQTESLCYAPEINTILEKNYIPILNENLKRKKNLSI